MEKYKITYIEKLGGEIKKTYAKDEIEAKNKTNNILNQGFYIKLVSKWHEAQKGYFVFGAEKVKMLELYDTKQNLKNYIQLMNK